MTFLRTLQRIAYLTSRTAGDAAAARAGRLPRRYARRQSHTPHRRTRAEQAVPMIRSLWTASGAAHVWARLDGQDAAPQPRSWWLLRVALTAGVVASIVGVAGFALNGAGRHIAFGVALGLDAAAIISIVELTRAEITEGKWR